MIKILPLKIYNKRFKNTQRQNIKHVKMSSNFEDCICF